MEGEKKLKNQKKNKLSFLKMMQNFNFIDSFTMEEDNDKVYSFILIISTYNYFQNIK